MWPIEHIGSKKNRRRSLTIAKEDNTSIVPGLKDLFFQHDLGDQILGRPVNKVSHRHQLVASANDGEVARKLAHGLSGTGTPLFVLLALFTRFSSKDFSDCPSDGVSLGGED